MLRAKVSGRGAACSVCALRGTLESLKDSLGQVDVQGYFVSPTEVSNRTQPDAIGRMMEVSLQFVLFLLKKDRRCSQPS